MVRLVTVSHVICFLKIKNILNLYSTERSHLCCLCFQILIALMFLCTYFVFKAKSCVTFSMIFATRASIICIDSGTCDTIRVSLALAIRFFDISINRYTPNLHPMGPSCSAHSGQHNEKNHRTSWAQWVVAVKTYCQTSNISHTFVGNKIVDHSDIVGASAVGTAPTTSPL